MRRMLRRTNLTGRDADGLPDNRVTFDAAEAEGLLKGLAQSMSMERVRDYLNVMYLARMSEDCSNAVSSSP